MDILSDEEMLRYNRQIILKNFDFDGQEALKQSSILIIGAGGLGCASSQYLAAAGIGSLTLVDDDKVELSNLQRQVLHNDDSIGVDKVESARTALSKINPNVMIKTINHRLDDAALEAQIKEHDLVLDATDNVDTRNQLNRLCFKHKKPLVCGAAIRMEGQVSVFTYQDDNLPCYACLSALFGDTTLSCVEAGVMSPVVGIIGATQALEAIKVLAKYGQPKIGKLLIFDGLSLSWRDMGLPKSKACKVCGV
ncbi:molybdopterin-synthase adenylyltransferase MoeB [Vibrio mediterranei]|uniref:molybdopterin-synthase adenylyltransferase MoeB n=1 Tax=Vibrio mediterranei TaxID=689 RepID=UPI000D17F8FB|nr:molybdopterin-synthase adenylyltransferase MoeB [Vibrio mediterranei]MCG9663592.1 molybdopterin-synthase adenylyltransferase MoeB [Vibrio mediterranei]PTC06983.1 molybdopterin-synthase adenylyltransferase MoeB [Vibrio mediterranei]